MTRPGHLAAAAAVAAAAGMLAAGCGSAAPAGRAPGVAATPSALPPLATSIGSASATWAVAVMGGPAARHDNFWQLFVRPAGSSTWRLVTPPGTPDNGGLVLAGPAGRSLVTGFRPSQYLTFSPLAATADNGSHWSQAGVLDSRLADVPGALAAAPGTGRLLALLASGTAQLGGPGGSAWTTLTTRRALAASPAGRACGLGSLTAAAFATPQVPLLAGACTRPGTAGIFADRSGTWHAAGPALPSSLARQRVEVLRLTRTGTGTGIVALLAAGTGPAARLLAAWTADGGSHWTLSPSLRLGRAPVRSASFGTGGAVAIVLNGGRGVTVAGPGSSWQPLPALPAGTATLTLGPAGSLDALAVHRTRLTDWRLAPGATAWRAGQAITVPVQFGSSS
jgi:hypothetical protein